MSFEDREVCFAPVFSGRGLIKSIFLNVTFVPAMLSLLLPLFVIVSVLTLGRSRPRGELTCAIKRVWYQARHCPTGNETATLVL